MDPTNQSILEAVRICLEKQMQGAPDRLEPSMVKAVEGDLCRVSLKNVDYSVPNGTAIPFAPGDNVWLMKPGGDLKKMFIIAKRRK